MTILATAIFLYLLVSMAIYLHVFGVFNPSNLRVFQIVLYLLLICFALTIGFGIENVLRYLQPTGITLAAVNSTRTLVA
ncbi:MAG TPA: hypothetical protein VK901_05170 [Nitrospiraceae bacterium]|nr:hypothetical protein [Nitrospiraceae bacterium]